MLVKGLNDGDECLRGVTAFLDHLQPDRTYLSIPTRPPAEAGVHPPTEEILNRAYQILSESVDQVEYLIGYEGNAFAFTGDVEEDLLSITAVHPMRTEAVSDLLARAGTDWALVHGLIARGQLIQVKYGGTQFYLRKYGGSTQED